MLGLDYRSPLENLIKCIGINMFTRRNYVMALAVMESKILFKETSRSKYESKMWAQIGVVFKLWLSHLIWMLFYIAQNTYGGKQVEELQRNICWLLKYWNIRCSLDRCIIPLYAVIYDTSAKPSSRWRSVNHLQGQPIKVSGMG